MHTAESDHEVCIILLRQTPGCASHRGIRLHGIILVHTSESGSTVPVTSRSFIWHRRVRAVFCHDLWKLLMGQSVEKTEKIRLSKRISLQNRIHLLKGFNTSTRGLDELVLGRGIYDHLKNKKGSILKLQKKFRLFLISVRIFITLSVYLLFYYSLL